MKFTTSLMVLMATFSLINAIPIDKRDVPYEITSPTANSTVQVNQNLVITWNKGIDNSPINIGLIAGSDEPLSASSIVISSGISGSIGTVVYPVSLSLGNGTSTWRVAISHGSDAIQYSPPFYISTLQQNQAQQPSFTASSNNATYSAAASISILGPDGQPVPIGGSSQASSLSVFVVTYLFVPVLCYMLM